MRKSTLLKILISGFNMKSMILLSLLISTVCFSATKNLIFIVADGMGLASIAGTRVYYNGAKGKLNIERFKTIGLSKTYSSDNYTTDSAAGATAFATGTKTYNEAISVDPNKKPLKTIFDMALENNKKIGIVTTTSVTHATPACFYAHANNRSEELNIASQVKDSKLSFLLGGGSKFFKKYKNDLLKSGWFVIDKKSQLNSLSKTKPVLGLFAKNHLNYSIKNKKQPSLLDMVKAGLTKLESNEEGYIFLIEAGRIDHASHANLAKEHFGEVMELDKTVKYLIENINLKNTIIVLTADHETAGLALSGYGDINKVKGDYFLNNKSRYGNNPFISWATGPAALNSTTHKSTYPMVQANHTTIDVPVYSIGLGHEKMGGFMENNQITRKIMKLMGMSI